jgi:CDP-paratose 2-epimerase
LFSVVDTQLTDFQLFNGKTLNIGGGLNCSASLQELTVICENLTANKIKIGTVSENRVADVPLYITDNTQINQLCDWFPVKNIQNILHDTFQWMVQNESKLKLVLNP